MKPKTTSKAYRSKLAQETESSAAMTLLALRLGREVAELMEEVEKYERTVEAMVRWAARQECSEIEDCGKCLPCLSRKRIREAREAKAIAANKKGNRHDH